MQETAPSRDIVTDAPSKKKRVVGIDIARGLALIGLLATHIFPNADENTGKPTLAQDVFAGDSAALFVLLAGTGLALLTGRRTPHRGLRMSAHRTGLAVRAALVGLVGLAVAMLMPEEPPAFGILLFFAVYFLLAIPFLALGPRDAFAAAAAFGLVGPVLMQNWGPELPESSTFNHTLEHLVAEPAGTLSELLLTGAYPALVYMAFILTGLGLGRLDLHSTRVQGLIAVTGTGLAVLANAGSHLLLHGAGGYQALLGTPGMTQETLDEALAFGPGVLPDTSWWWLVIAAPHSSTPFALASSIGISMMVLGVVLLVASRFGRWLAPLTAMGAMTMTLYTAHMVALSFEVHYDDPVLWFIVQLSVALVFATVWTRWVGRGPLEWVMTAGARPAQRFVMDQAAIDVTPHSPPPAGNPPVLQPSPGTLPAEARPSSGTDQATPPPPEGAS